MTSRPRKLDVPRRGPRKPSEDELALWQHATRDIAPTEASPLAPSSRRPLKLSEPRGYDPLPSRPAPSVPARRFYPNAAQVDALTDSTPGLDRRTSKSLRKGERAPDARVDLHGMTLDRAHAALTRFILIEQARGSRCALVITGKGGNYQSRADGSFDLHGGGALKRDVPRWLREPALSGAVVGVYQAHKRHGGDGALYVYLRKPR